MKYILLTLLFFTLLLSNETTNKFQEEFLTSQQKEFIKNHPIIRVSNEKDWAPYDYNENGVPKGYAIDYLKLLAKKIGVTIVFDTDKWSSLIEKIKNKELDVIHPLTTNEERKKYLHFSEPFIKYNMSIVTSDTNSDIKTLEDLKFKRVSVAKGWNSTKYLKKHYPEIIFKEYSGAKEKLEAVAFGEADATIDLYLTVNYLKQKHLLNNIKIAGRAKLGDFNSDLHIGVRKDWAIFSDIIKIAMTQFSHDGIAALNQKWMNVSSKEISFTKEELKYLDQKDKISMCIDPDWFPYEKIQNNKHVGMSHDYFELFRKLLPLPIELLPTRTWIQTLKYAQNRKCDIISLAVKTPKRSEYLDFPQPYIKLPLVVATKLDKPFVSSLNDILEHKLGVMRGYFLIELLRNKYPNIKLVEVDSMQEGFEKILSGETYGFIDSLTVVGHKIQKEYLGNVKIAGKIDEEVLIGVATRNDEPLLHAIFEKVVNTLTPDDHQKILNKWVSVKYDKAFDYSYVWKVLLFVFVVIGFFLYRQYLLKKQNVILRESQKRLQNSVEEFEHIIDSTMEAILIFENKICIDANSEAVTLLGYAHKEDLIGIGALDVIDSIHHDLVRDKFKLDASEPYEVQGIKKDGTLFPVLIKGHNILLRNKKVRISAMLDLTDVKNKEKLLSEHSKMVALGEMLGNIAHQWRQPLSVISTAASGVRIQKEMGILNDDVFYDSMDGIVKNANYLSSTIDDFRCFIHQDKTKISFSLNEHIKKDLTILKGMLNLNDIEIVLDLDEDIQLFNIENELTQVIINIINNAKDAFIENKIEDRYIFIKTFVKNNQAYIVLQDNAGGILDHIIDKVFEPYFTTKHKEQGTGLGLYMSNQIITNSMEGTIKVKNRDFGYLSQQYRGAEFTISLPL